MDEELEKELLDLKAECRENPNIHPHCEHVVDLAIAEIKRLGEQYTTDTIWFHNKYIDEAAKAKILQERIDVVKFYAQEWTQSVLLGWQSIGHQILLMLDGSIKKPVRH